MPSPFLMGVEMPENWMNTVTGWADKALTAVIDKKVNNPHELQKMQLSYYGDYGLGFGNPALGGVPGQPVGGISSGVVVLGAAALLLIVLLRD